MSGIQIENTISMAVQNRNHRRNTFFLVIIAFFGAMGGVFTFLSMFQLQYHKTAMVSCFLIEFILCTIAAMTQGKRKFWKALFGAGYAVLIFNLWKPFSTGFIYLVNTVYKVIYLTEWDRFTVSDQFTEQYSVSVFLILICFPILYMICYAVIHFQNFFLSLIATFPYVEIGFYFGVAPDHTFAIMLYAFWFSMAAVHLSNFGAYHGKDQNSFLRRDNTFFPVSSMRFMVTEKIGFLVLCVVLALCIGVEQILQAADYKRSDNIKELRRNAQEKFNSMMFDDPDGFWSFMGLNRRIGKDRVVVKLGREEKQEYLNVSISGLTFSDLPEGRLYLKYLTGETYNDNVWSLLPLDVYENNEVFELFTTLNYYPPDFLYKHMSRQDPRRITMTMQNLNRVVRQSVPYGFMKNDELVYLHDNQFTDFPDSYEILQNQNYEEFLINAPDAQLQFDDMYTASSAEMSAIARQSEQVYHDFVMEYHTALPDTQAMQNVRDAYAYLLNYFDAGTATPSETMEFLQQLREAVSSNAVYTLAPGRTPVDRDFVEYFLLDNRKGYCMHYATAGVVLARMAGIPARYCEGYMVDCSDNPTLEQIELDGEEVYTVDVLDSNAHAWVEFYIDGWGWIPFEFTYTQTEEQPVPQEPVTETTAAPVATRPPASTTIPVGVLNPEIPQEETPDINILPFLIILGCLLGIAVILGGIYLLWKLSERKRSRLFAQKDKNRAAVCAYRYLLRLLAYCGVNTHAQKMADIADEGMEKCNKYLGKYNLEAAVAVAAKAKFSQHTISDSELSLLIKTAKHLASAIYRDSPLLRRIGLRYFLHMI